MSTHRFGVIELDCDAEQRMQLHIIFGCTNEYMELLLSAVLTAEELSNWITIIFDPYHNIDVNLSELTDQLNTASYIDAGEYKDLEARFDGFGAELAPEHFVLGCPARLVNLTYWRQQLGG